MVCQGRSSGGARGPRSGGSPSATTDSSCATRCIDIAYFDAGAGCTARGDREILIEGDTFVNRGAHGTIHRGFVPHCPIRVGHADGAVIRNNTFEDAARTDRPTRVLIEDSDHVTIEGNRNLPPGSIERR